jgi:murein DD-endopeptidase MepM/ murein hydrolase activator NlpD
MSSVSATATMALPDVLQTDLPFVMTNTVELMQEPEQGAFIVGHAPLGAKVKLGDRELLLSKRGEFAFAIGRNQTDDVVLDIEYTDGAKETKTYAVKKHEWEVQHIDGLPSKHVTPPPEVYERIKSDNALIISTRIKSDNTPYFGFKNFIMPTKGVVSGIFGSQRVLNGKPKSPHTGQDIAAPEGTPVVAGADGVVTMVHEDMYYTGKTVMIDHGFGICTIYFHMSNINVKKGDRVAQGDKIGEVGTTGRSTGAHLHWGATWYGVKFDVAKLVDFEHLSETSEP